MNYLILRSVAVVLGAWLMVAGCGRAKAEKDAKAAAPPPPAVVVTQVVQRNAPIMREFVARTEAVPTVEIRARVPGILEQVRFREGSLVKQGEVLFVIQQAEYKASVQTADAQLAKAQADLSRARDVSTIDRSRAQLEQSKADLGKTRQDVARYRPLAQEKAIPQQDLDTAISKELAAAANVDAAEAALKDTVLQQRTAIQLAEAAVESAKASLIQANLNLSYTVVESPIAGIIGKLNVDRGNLVGKGEATLLATVSSLDPMFADFSVTEADYLRVVKRAPWVARGEIRRDVPPALELIMADGTTLPHKGRYVFVDRAIDLKTGTIAVRAEFPNPERTLRPGQFGRVRLVYEDVPNAILVPQVAVQELQGAKTVFVVGDGDKVAQRTVTLGDVYKDFYLITAGLKPGERVIVEGIQKARPGMQVKAELKTDGIPAAPAAAVQLPAASPATKPNSER
jgi:membrane fusion protein (multidrug efflux system)